MTDYDRIIRVLEAGVTRAKTANDKEELYKALRLIGAVASHEALKIHLELVLEAEPEL